MDCGEQGRGMNKTKASQAARNGSCDCQGFSLRRRHCRRRRRRRHRSPKEQLWLYNEPQRCSLESVFRSSDNGSLHRVSWCTLVRLA